MVSSWAALRSQKGDLYAIACWDESALYATVSSFVAIPFLLQSRRGQRHVGKCAHWLRWCSSGCCSMRVCSGSRSRRKAHSTAFERLYSRVTSRMCKRGEVCPSEAEKRMLHSTRRLHFTSVVGHAGPSLPSLSHAIGQILSISKASVVAGTSLPRTWTARDY